MTPFIQPAYKALFARWGPQHWWPAQSRLEMMLGVTLTQNTAWANVEKAIANLRRNGANVFQDQGRTFDISILPAKEQGANHQP